MVSENNKIKFEGHEFWTRKDGIIGAKIDQKLNQQILEKLVVICIELTEKNQNKSNKLLVDLKLSPKILDLNFRKLTVNTINDLYKAVSFEKIAFWGLDGAKKIIASFIIGATGRKNIKIFKTEEEALKWLKES